MVVPNFTDGRILSDFSNCNVYTYYQQKNFATYTISNNEISGGDFCIVEDPSSCSDTSANLSYVTTLDNSYNVCGNKGTSVLDLIHSSSSALETGVDHRTNIQSFVLLIIGIFLSVIIYAIFGIGTFMFWIEYAPRIIIEKGCHAGKSLLDRYYEFNKNELPYDWEKLEECPKPAKVSFPSLDKCPQENNLEMQQKLASVSGGSVWDNITYFIGGFPYNGIDKQKEVAFKSVNGNYLLFSLFIAGILVGFLNIGKSYTGNRNAGNTALSCVLSIGFFGLVSLGFKYLPKIVHHEIKNDKIYWTLTGLIIAILVIITILTAFNGSGDAITGFSIGFGIIFILITGIFAHLDFGSKEGTVSQYTKDIRFLPAFLKGIYYFKKSFINSIKESLISGRWVTNKGFSWLGHLGLPHWFLIFFGKIVAPAAFAIITFLRLIWSGCGSLKGAFSWNEDVDSEKLEDAANERVKSGEHSKEVYDTTKNTSVRSRLLHNFKSKRHYIKSGFKKAEAKMDTFWTGLFLTITMLQPVFAILMAILNMVFFFFSYHFIPLTHPKILLNIISCNIKKLGFLFGMGVVAMCWAQEHKGESPLPKEVLIWMSLTFGAITLYNLITG